MKKGCVIGYDINEKGCQISYYDDSKEEPETMMASSNNYQIPLVLGYFKDRWVFGKEAKRLSVVGGGCTESELYEKAIRREKVTLAGKTYDAVWLLAKYISLTLVDFENIRYLTFTTPETDVDIAKMLKGIGQHLGIDKENISVQDYKESFCQYMIFQPKELWQYESALFYCDEENIKAYMLRRLSL